jgi:hypothetical protein
VPLGNQCYQQLQKHAYFHRALWLKVSQNNDVERHVTHVEHHETIKRLVFCQSHVANLNLHHIVYDLENVQEQIRNKVKHLVFIDVCSKVVAFV